LAVAVCVAVDGVCSVVVVVSGVLAREAVRRGFLEKRKFQFSMMVGLGRGECWCAVKSTSVAFAAERTVGLSGQPMVFASRGDASMGSDFGGLCVCETFGV